jgi:hypothetical protein
VHLFRCPMAAFVCAIIVGIAVSVSSSPSLADEGITQLKTSSGILIAREVLGNDCGSQSTFAEPCIALYFNDRVLLADNHLDITRVFPSKENPQLVDIETSTGGNGCCWESYILDFTTRPPRIMKGHSFGSEISRTESGVVFQDSAGKDTLA